MSVSRVKFSVEDFDVSRFIAGFWRLNDWAFSDQTLRAYVENLLSLGVTTMDHAWVYRSETQFGRLIAKEPSLRDKIEIVSKFGIRPVGFGELGAEATNYYDSSAKYLVRSVEHSLQALNTDYLDLLLVHRPDYLMRADEIAAAFSQLHEQGKVRYFGVSNFSPSQFDLLQCACDFPLITNQVEFSPTHLSPLDSGVFDQCQLRHIRPMLWSCLGGGNILTSNDERAIRIRSALQAVGQALGADSLEQVIYAWVLALPCEPLPIIGSSNLQRVENAVKAEQWHVNKEQWYHIWEAATGHRVP